jgi:hypothetical protein
VLDRLYRVPEIGEFLQGDIFEDTPSVFLASRPIRVARFLKETGDNVLYGVHTEDGRPPRDGFKWLMNQGGEGGILVHGHMGRAMLISNDCEIENDTNTRTLAMIRPLTDFEPRDQERMFSGREEDLQYGVFPLEAQAEDPSFDRTVLDLRRLTTVRPDVLASTMRLASASEVLRDAIAEAFRLYLFRRTDT